MKALLQPFKELEEIYNIKENIRKKNTPVYITGCIDSQKCHLIYGLSSVKDKFTIIVTYNELRAKEMYEDMKLFSDNVYLYPAKDIIFFNANIHSNYIIKKRIETIKRIIEEKNSVIILTIDAAIDNLLPLSTIQQNCIQLKLGDCIQFNTLLQKLIKIGYKRVDQVEAQGQFSVRGGILDIYCLTEEVAYRIEFFDDEIDTIRTMDILNQRSIENIDNIMIYPASELIINEKDIEKAMNHIDDEYKTLYNKFIQEKKGEVADRLKDIIEEIKEKIVQSKNLNGLESYLHFFYEKTVNIFNYFSADNTVIFLDEPNRLLERCDTIFKEFAESMKQRLEKGYLLPTQTKMIFSYSDLMHTINQKPLVLISTLNQSIKDLNIKEHFNIVVKSINHYNNSFETLIKDLIYWQKKKYKIILLAGSKTRAERLTQELKEREIKARYTTDFETEIIEGETIVAYGNIHKGFEYPLIQYIVISESDVFGKSKIKKKKKNKYQGKKIQSFTDLSIGDYVVHENHGLGIFKGIETIEVENTAKDYIKIAYADGGNLYVSTSQLDIIQKYIGTEGRKPKLNKLGSPEWKKTKKRVKRAVQDIAKELIELYAARQAKKGFKYSVDTVWQKEFEEMFPYEETRDQMIAIEEAKKDMESYKIMDRLICGDVGYGKTEVAIRVAFKAVQDGKQVAYLVPTTILAQQHYNNFVQRMKDFPVHVEMLSRFRTAKEQKITIEGIRKGAVDIVVGTHRLLSKDLVYKNIGLLIIDEEQRFGVTHKEKIKKLKDNIDVLTLTATPIPRTLHMSLIGIRDMSVLEEPPEERLPIQTYVMEYDDEMIREAITRELGRNGQVYYVYNRVQNIEEISTRISQLVPQANIAYAHGQMKERELEQIMYDFINGEIDVLVATTIIETGLDISNVNTIIIHDADRMGLSQLYQLRGRVGRSNRIAYAYLCYQRNKILKETAEKRLQAIREFTELGSGFKIAMRDLEIRGAGNIIGHQQHGHMEAVGYDLYCKLLDEAITSLKDDNQEESFETVIDLNVDAYIPPRYIKNEIQKLDIYKRIASIENEEDYHDMQDELLDRYGDMPTSVINLLMIALIKSMAHNLGITCIEQKNNTIKFIIKNDAPLDPEKIPNVLLRFDNKLSFSVKEVPFFTYKIKKLSQKELFIQIKNILQALNDLKK